MVKILVMADIEGKWSKIQSFIDNSDNLLTVTELTVNHKCPLNELYKFGIKLGDDTHIVVLGDIMDKGTDNIKCLSFILQLKEKYKNNVHLIVGNRDINKLRFYFELKNDKNKDNTNLFGNKFYLGDGYVPKKCFWKTLYEKRWDTKFDGDDKIESEKESIKNSKINRKDILKLKFLLRETLGCPDMFKDLKIELNSAGHCNNECYDKVQDNITQDYNNYKEYKKDDEIVYDKFVNELILSPDSMYKQYLDNANLYYLAENSLFVHGGISEEIVNKKDELEKELEEENKTFKKIFKKCKYISTTNKVEDNDKINIYTYLFNIQEAGIKNNNNGCDNWVDNSANNESLIMCRPWDIVGNHFTFVPLKEEVTDKLVKNEIKRIFYGHSPVGNIPIIYEHYKKEDNKENDEKSSKKVEFTEIMCDTSFSNNSSIFCIKLDNEIISIKGKYSDKKCESTDYCGDAIEYTNENITHDDKNKFTITIPNKYELSIKFEDLNETKNGEYNTAKISQIINKTVNSTGYGRSNKKKLKKSKKYKKKMIRSKKNR